MPSKFDKLAKRFKRFGVEKNMYNFMKFIKSYSIKSSVSWNHSYSKCEFLCPFNKATEKTEKTCFALDQFYIKLKTKSLFTSTSNVLPFKFKCLAAICGMVKLIP